MSAADALFQFDHRALDVRRAQVVEKIQAQGGDDIIGRELHGHDAVGAADAGDAGGRFHDGVAQRRVCALADQQLLRFSREQCRDRRENDRDGERGHSIPAGIPSANRERGPGSRREDAQNRGTVFEHHDECRRIFRAAKRFPPASIALGRAKCTDTDEPGCSFERQRHAKDDENNAGPLDRHGVQQATQPLIDRHTGAQRKNQQGDHEAPEIQLTSVPQRVAAVGGTGRARDAVEQQKLVDGVDQGMHGFAQHGRRAGDGGGDELRRGHQQVARQGRPDGRIGSALRHDVLKNPLAAPLHLGPIAVQTPVKQP